MYHRTEEEEEDEEEQKPVRKDAEAINVNAGLDAHEQWNSV